MIQLLTHTLCSRFFQLLLNLQTVIWKFRSHEAFCVCWWIALRTREDSTLPIVFYLHNSLRSPHRPHSLEYTDSTLRLLFVSVTNGFKTYLVFRHSQVLIHCPVFFSITSLSEAFSTFFTSVVSHSLPSLSTAVGGLKWSVYKRCCSHSQFFLSSWLMRCLSSGEEPGALSGLFIHKSAHLCRPIFMFQLLTQKVS